MGARDGDEVVQLYLPHHNSRIVQPARELKGFQCIHITACQQKTVRFEIPAQAVAYWNTRKPCLGIGKGHCGRSGGLVLGSSSGWNRVLDR